MEIVLLSLPSNLFYRQSLRSGLLSVLAADASLRRQAPEYFSCFFGSVSPKSFLSPPPQCLFDATKSVFSFLITSRCFEELRLSFTGFLPLANVLRVVFSAEVTELFEILARGVIFF